MIRANIFISPQLGLKHGRLNYTRRLAGIVLCLIVLPIVTFFSALMLYHFQDPFLSKRQLLPNHIGFLMPGKTLRLHLYQ